MPREVAEFLEQFPGAVDVVLVRSERWTEEHKAIMDALTEGVRMFCERAGTCHSNNSSTSSRSVSRAQ